MMIPSQPPAVSENATDTQAIGRQSYLEAVRATSGTWPGIIAWGLVSGMAMVKAGLTIWQAVAMTLLVFAGSAQLAALPLMMTHTPVLMVFATALVVNLRFVIFSAAISPHFAHLPWRSRLWYGYFCSDIMMAFFPQRFVDSSLAKYPEKKGFYWGIATANWVTWQSGALMGIFLANQIPQSWQVGFAGTLALLALMIPLTINLAALAGVLVSGAVAVTAAGLPYRLGVVLGVACGMVVAMLIDRRKSGHG